MGQKNSLKYRFYQHETLLNSKKLDFVKDHTTGSHIIFYHANSGRRATVPFHLGDMKKGTLHSLLVEAGISADELVNTK